MEDQVKITPRVLQRDGFDEKHPAFDCFVADHDGSIVGYALYYTCYSTWVGKSVFLEDLYVRSDYRSLGVGLELFQSVGRVAHETSHRMDFHVLSWNPATQFYEKLGAVNLTSAEKWQVYRMGEEALRKLVERQ